jgi:hypothetical protein
MEAGSYRSAAIARGQGNLKLEHDFVYAFAQN